MSHAISLTILTGIIIILSFMLWRVVHPHQVRLLIGNDVEIIMTCREPLIIGDGLCLPEGHTYRGVYEEWVE
jgi:hypothetical protein